MSCSKKSLNNYDIDLKDFAKYLKEIKYNYWSDSIKTFIEKRLVSIYIDDKFVLTLELDADFMYDKVAGFLEVVINYIESIGLINEYHNISIKLV